MTTKSTVDGRKVTFTTEWIFVDDGSPILKYKSECIDCGLNYEEFPIDLLLPDNQWKKIHKGVNGVICPSCIIKRIAKFPEAIIIKANVEGL